MTSAMDLLDDLDDVLGENAGASLIRGWLDTGIPELNKSLCGKHEGGFPMGRVLEIFGQESSGKTFIATMAMISVQRMNGIAFFADHERSFEPNFAEHLGLDLDRSVFRHMKPKTLEDDIDALSMVARKVREKLPIEIPCVWVIDSIASMIPSEVLYKKDARGKATEDFKDSADYNMRDQLALARATSATFKMLKMIAEDYNFCIIMLNQTRTDPTVIHGNPTTTPGGKTPAFVADIRLSLGKKMIKDDKTKETLGFEVEAKTVKNKIFRPDKKAKWTVMFGEEGGVFIDTVRTNVEYAIRKGLIEQSGARVKWKGKSLYKSQLVEWLKTKSEDYGELIDLILDGKPEEE